MGKLMSKGEVPDHAGLSGVDAKTRPFHFLLLSCLNENFFGRGGLRYQKVGTEV